MKTEAKAICRQWNWSSLDALAAWVVAEALRIQQIAAPTFHEAERARYVAGRFAAFGLAAVEMDDVSNVYGYLPGKTGGAAILILAHTDTVFAADADLSIQRRGGTIHAPGIGDNSMGVAGLLGLIKALHDYGEQPACDIWFVANSCEEGLGDLKGAKTAFARLQSQISAVINLEGLAFGHVYNAGIAVHRLRITAHAAGGHSWLHYGQPSAVHSILELGTQIASLKMPSRPRTTCNIGLIDGGHAINAIASRASLWLDMRSVSPAALEKLRGQVHQLVRLQEKKGLRCDIEVVGDRPAGAIPADHVLVQGALSALALIGVKGSLEAGSTDANVPLSQGCPAVTIGITRGGNAHRLDEFIEVQPVRSGMKQLVTLALAAARYYAHQAAQATSRQSDSKAD